MRFEFHYRTYDSFGPNATLLLLSQWLESKLPDRYGPDVDGVLVEACCRNLSPPKGTLETLNERFESWRRELPLAELIERGRTIRFSYAAVYPTREEVERDRQVLSLRTFQLALKKAATLIGEAPRLLGVQMAFNAEGLRTDLLRLVEEAPSSLIDLAKLYLDFSGKPGGVRTRSPSGH